MPRHLLAPLAAVLALLSVPALRATVLVPADLIELSRSAAVIVRGTVTSVDAGWADGRRRIETVVALDVQQTLKGDVGRTLSFKVPGGRVGRYRSVMVGAPSFQQGEEVILFLGAQPPALPFLLGLGQGVYRVQRDARTGEARVSSPVLVADREQPVIVRRGERTMLSVEEFNVQVREALAPRTRLPGRKTTTGVDGKHGR